MDAPNVQRASALKTLANEEFDVLVVGGGITGCGVARDAALRGFKTALIEKLDFGAGTSSKSSKLVHGGLRYLEQAEFKLVFESVNERRLLMDKARHLVRPLPFLVTRFKGDKRWLVTLDFGLWMYDALCLFRSYKIHQTFGPKRTLQLEPTLRAEGLSGGILYYDCLTDDARLTLENAIDARQLGATLVNHARAGKLLKDATGKVCGVQVEDLDPQGAGAKLDVRAKVVINATGPWSDEVRALADEPPILKPTKGVHIVVSYDRLPVRHALMMASPRDKRTVFCIPWGGGRTVIGTTDTFYDGRADDCHADADDAKYLLETANAYFPAAKLEGEDIISTWTGLRPLLKPEDEGRSASKVSREHVLFEKPGFLTIAGGKLTTYRRIAYEVVDAACKQLGSDKKTTSEERYLPGSVGLESDEQLEQLASTLPGNLSAGAKDHLAKTFGTRAKDVIARIDKDPTAAEAADPELPWVMAQVDEAVQHEFARTLDDVMTRRLPLVLRAKDQGLGIAEKIAARVGQQLQWSPEQTASQLSAWRQVVANSRRWRT